MGLRIKIVRGFDVVGRALARKMLGPREIGVFACVVNFGILVFNLGFTHADALAAPNAAVFSPFGQVMVLVWGIAFLLAGLTNGDGRPSSIWWAFAVEKLCYVCAWLLWMRANDIAALLRAAQSSGDIFALMTPAFHAIYGPIDFVFLCLFAHLGWRSLSPPAAEVGRKKR